MSADTEQPEITDQPDEEEQYDENSSDGTFKVPEPKVHFFKLDNISDSETSDIIDFDIK